MCGPPDQLLSSLVKLSAFIDISMAPAAQRCDSVVVCFDPRALAVNSPIAVRADGTMSAAALAWDQAARIK
jgi:hypothetical protein